MGDDPSPSMASDPPPPPPKDRSAPESSKRKWNPSTWRYHIEEGQPELGSKPRRDSYIFPSSAQRERDREREREKAAALEPPKRTTSPDKEDGCDQIACSPSPNRLQSSERTGILKKQGQREFEEAEDAVKRNGIQEASEKMKKRKKKEGMRKRTEKEGEVCTKEGLRRRTRELTPSELYFCEICSGKLGSNEGGSPTGC